MAIEKISEDYEIEKVNRYRIRLVFSLFPFIIINGFKSDFHWIGKWFKYITIREQLVKYRIKYFDDGWTYQYYWGGWKEKWQLIEIVK